MKSTHPLNSCQITNQICTKCCTDCQRFSLHLFQKSARFSRKFHNFSLRNLLNFVLPSVNLLMLHFQIFEIFQISSRNISDCFGKSYPNVFNTATDSRPRTKRKTLFNRAKSLIKFERKCSSFLQDSHKIYLRNLQDFFENIFIFLSTICAPELENSENPGTMGGGAKSERFLK